MRGVILSVLADTAYPRLAARTGLRIAWCARPGNCPHDPQVISVAEAAVGRLVELGHNIIDYDLDIDGWQEAFGPLVLHK